MLLNAYPKLERSNLYKIGCFELVALMGAQNPPLTNGNMIDPRSPGAILYGAITVRYKFQVFSWLMSWVKIANKSLVTSP